MNSRMISDRALENQIDARVAHRALDRDRLFAARAQRIGGLVAAAAANLHGVVHAVPRALGVEQLRDRRLETNVVPAALVERGRQRATDSIANVSAVMRAIFCAIASCLPIGWPHCTRFIRPCANCAAAIAFEPPAHARRNRQPPGVERRQRELETLPLAQQHVLGRHLHVRRTESRRSRSRAAP